MADMVERADRTIVLLGRSGTDKIATVKSIFRGNLFESSQSNEVTAFSDRLGTTFLDTPALKEFSALEIADTVGKCCEKVKDGVDAILLVLPTKFRFSKEEVAAIQGLHKHFSKNFMGYFIVLFTQEDSQDKEHTMGDSLGISSYIVGLLKLCGERSFNFHFTKDEGRKQRKQERLVQLVENMVKTHHGRKLKLQDAFLRVQGEDVDDQEEYLENHAERKLDEVHCLMADMVERADRTLVLLGRSGTDKIATVKSIFRGNLFESSQSNEVTAFSDRLGTTFLDTPALKEFSALEIADTVGKCCEKVKDGVDAILLVLPTKFRFSNEEVAAIQGLHEHFSKNFMGYFIVLFTQEGSQDKEHTMGNSLGISSYIGGLLKLCGERYFNFHFTKDEGRKQRKQERLVQLVENMVTTHHGRKLKLQDAFLRVQGEDVDDQEEYLENHAERELDEVQRQAIKQNDPPQDMGCNPYTIFFTLLLLSYLIFREVV